MAGIRLGRYDIIKTLVKGEMTDLLLGRASGMEGFERYVAIKMLRPEHAKDPPCLEAFVNEARLAAALHHHNIIQLLDIGDEGGRPYFAMEYVHGVDLRTLLARLAKRNEQLPLQHVVAIVASAAAALHHAHEQKGPDGKPLGIVHRDVTPANILVGFDGNVKVVDFGIAKAAIRRLQTAQGVLKGRVPYMAPEQCAGKAVDRRSDVFALGIVLFELATVRRLFKGATEFLTMSAIVSCEIPRPSQYRRDVPPELEVIMMKALAADPGARFQSAGEMSLELDKVASKVGVGASTTALANYMRLQFGDQKEPWLSDVDIDSETTDVDFDGAASGLAPPPAESVKNNAIPKKALDVSRSSPIVQVRNATPSRPIETKPLRAKSPTEDPVTLVDPPRVPVAPTKPTTRPPAARPFELRATAKLPEPMPVAKVPSRAMAAVSPATEDAFAAKTLVGPPDEETLRSLAGSPSRATPSQFAVPPKPGNRDGIDMTEIVVPLPALPRERPVIIRHPTQPKSRPLWLWIALLVGAVVVAAGVVVLWPGADVASQPSAAPAREPTKNDEPIAKVEPPATEPASGLEATMSDYDKAKAVTPDAAMAVVANTNAADEKVAIADVKAEAKPEVKVVKPEVKVVKPEVKVVKPEVKAVAKPNVVAEAKPKAKAKSEVAEAKPKAKAKPELVAEAKPQAKTTAGQVKRTTPKPVAKPVRTQAKPAAKKSTKKKPKWNPDDLFLGE